MPNKQNFTSHLATCLSVSVTVLTLFLFDTMIYVHLLYMHSILGRSSFCFNYCLNSAWHGGDQFAALLRWYGSPGFFDSVLQLICIVGSGVSHLYSLWGSGQASLLTN